MGKTTTEMQLVPLSKLVPYVNNARTHSPEQLAKLRSSLREFGFINPVIIDRDFNVIAGHGRIAAAKEEGITEVPCVFVDYLTEAQKKAYILADNRMALDAGWDEELLRIEIESLQGADFDVSLTGFGEDEIADLFSGDGEKDVKDDDFDLSAALEKAAFVEKGDIWTVGRHRLMCGDATSAEDVAALMDGKKANLIVTDPPYNVAFKSGSGLSIQNDSMENGEFYTFLYNSFTDAALENLRKLVDAKGSLIKKALAVDSLPIETDGEKVSFPWFAEGQDSESVKAYTHFIAAICDMARNQKRITAKEKPADNEKYAFRCFLLRLGFIGAEYKGERKILLKNLSGSSAFKNGERKEAVSSELSE